MIYGSKINRNLGDPKPPVERPRCGNCVAWTNRNPDFTGYCAGLGSIYLARVTGSGDCCPSWVGHREVSAILAQPPQATASASTPPTGPSLPGAPEPAVCPACDGRTWVLRRSEHPVCAVPCPTCQRGAGNMVANADAFRTWRTVKDADGNPTIEEVL